MISDWDAYDVSPRLKAKEVVQRVVQRVAQNGKLLKRIFSAKIDWPDEEQCEALFSRLDEMKSGSSESGPGEGGAVPLEELRGLQQEVLSAKALLAGGALQIPGYVLERLTGRGRLPEGLDWATALSMPWQEIVVPLRSTKQGSSEGELAWFLMGLMSEGKELASPSSCGRDHILCLRKGIMMEEKECEQPCPMGQGACRAATTAIRLAEEETGRSFVLFARHASYSFEGGSLALPVWLGAMTLARGLDASPVLATGALDKNGFLLPVEGIEVKASMRAISGAQRFVYPAASATRVPSGGFPIHRKEDALFLLQETDERFWRTVHPFSYDPMFFWDQLPVLTSWTRKRDWVEHALRYAEQCGCFELPEGEKGAVLGRVCSFLERFKNDLKDACDKVLKLFPLEWAEHQEKNTDIFRLCQIHITSLNHKGQVTREWEELAEHCRTAVQNSAHSVSPLFLEFYTRQCDSWYNLFFFEEPEELLAKMSEERARFSVYREQAVGKACGALCNGAAFRAAVKSSAEEYGNAFKLADESEANFGNDRQGMLDKLRRDLDRTYAYWDRQDDGDRERALFCADRYIRVTYEQDEEGNKPYAEALKARVRADIRKNGPLECPEPEWLEKDFRGEVEEFLQDGRKTRHPWMLYFYNAAIALQKEPDLYRECLERSYRLCEAGGGRLSTVSLLGLLPLSLLAEMPARRNFALIEAERLLSLLRAFSVHEPGKDVDKGLFNRAHFEPLLTCPAEEALQKVREDTKRFFPFNYR